MTSVFFSYSHKDEELRNQLEVHLAMLKRQGFIDTWHDRRIPAGDNLDDAINENLEKADIILLLVSPDFLASEYCYAVEMERAMERHRAGQARVIPVILRRSDWHDAPFGKLNATPPDGKPIKSYADLDEAFHDVTKDIKAALPKKPAEVAPVRRVVAAPALPTRFAGGGDVLSANLPRSSNLRLAQSFTEVDKDRFQEESFTFIRNFFRNSLDELKARNDGIETSFREIDANRFSAVIYKNGKMVARCGIRLGGPFGSGIAYSESDRDNSYSEQLTVESDDHALFFSGMMNRMGGQSDRKLTPEGAAEHLWEMLIKNLQGNDRY